jgi:hypothetical protein
MESKKGTARRAGVLYFLFMILGVYSEFFLPGYVVPGDATATASNISAGELSYRIGILVGFATHVVFLFLVVMLYRLLQDVDQSQALLMVIFVSVGVAVALSNMLNRFAPLQFLGGAEYLAVFTEPQLDALALASLRFRTAAAAVPLAFWGLWLLPFGSLVVKSRFLPRVLGILLLVAGVAYIVSSAVFIVMPAQRQVVSRFLMPLYFGEVPVIFWLLLKGAKPPQVLDPEAGRH